MEVLIRLCEKYALGEIQREPLPVAGGLLHRMYHVVTDGGNYAVKLLNPDIMKRPKALGNMVNSEYIAEYMGKYAMPETAGHISISEPGKCMPSDAIPAVSALKFQEKHLISIEKDNGNAPSAEACAAIPQQYAFVYPWLEARSLFAPEIGITHCRRVGHILGLMHHADIRPKEMPYKLEKEEARRSLYDWHGYLTLAREQQVPWLSEFEAMLPDLCRWDQAAVDAADAVHSCQVISHRDLDPKNILWQGDQPYLIDWEAAGYVNPCQELLEVLHYWGCDHRGIYDPDLCQALLQEYMQFMNLRGVDWAPIFACSYDSMLGWLEYTLKKSLGLEGDEKGQGLQQMLGAYDELRRYEAQASLLLGMVTF